MTAVSLLSLTFKIKLPTFFFIIAHRQFPIQRGKEPRKYDQESSSSSVDLTTDCVRKVMGSILVRDLDIFLFPMPVTCRI